MTSDLLQRFQLRTTKISLKFSPRLPPDVFFEARLAIDVGDFTTTYGTNQTALRIPERGLPSVEKVDILLLAHGSKDAHGQSQLLLTNDEFTYSGFAGDDWAKERDRAILVMQDTLSKVSPGVRSARISIALHYDCIADDETMVAVAGLGVFPRAMIAAERSDRRFEMNRSFADLQQSLAIELLNASSDHTIGLNISAQREYDMLTVHSATLTGHLDTLHGAALAVIAPA
jgi:hypothetical protein